MNQLVHAQEEALLVAAKLAADDDAFVLPQDVAVLCRGIKDGNKKDPDALIECRKWVP